MSRRYYENPRIIKVDGQEEKLLAKWLCDSGIALEVSGPRTVLLHEHNVTEYDGSPLDLNRGLSID